MENSIKIIVEEKEYTFYGHTEDELFQRIKNLPVKMIGFTTETDIIKYKEFLKRIYNE